MTTELVQLRINDLNGCHPGFDFDQGLEGFKLISDILPKQGDSLEPVPILEDWEGEGGINGEQLETRARAMGNLAGQLHAEYLYRRKETIPSSWEGIVLVFLGTDWRGQLECRPFPCLKHHMGGWRLFFLFLADVADVFTPDFRLVQVVRR